MFAQHSRWLVDTFSAAAPCKRICCKETSMLAKLCRHPVQFAATTQYSQPGCSVPTGGLAVIGLQFLLWGLCWLLCVWSTQVAVCWWLGSLYKTSTVALDFSLCFLVIVCISPCCVAVCSGVYWLQRHVIHMLGLQHCPNHSHSLCSCTHDVIV
jgi:hypothetical protein